MKFHRCVWFCVMWLAAFAVGAVPPGISIQPRDQSVALHQPAVLGVVATGAPPLAYQWRKNNAPVPGATSDQLNFPHVQFADVATYSVVISNAEGGAISADARLTVNLPTEADLDFTFVTGGLIDGNIYSLALQPDGRVLVAGAFSMANGAPRGRVARLNADGSTDLTFMNGLSGASAPVNSVAMQSDGKVLITGNFNSVNGVSRGRVARLHPDGSLDAGFLNGLPGADNSVGCVAVQSDGKILIGGSFSSVNNVNRRYLARLNADGTLDTSFLNGLSGADNPVFALAVQSDGKILIAGSFNNVNGVARNRIARLNADGTLDTAFQNGLAGASGSVLTVVAQSDGKVLIGGQFTTVNGVSRSRIARLNADGSLDAGFQNNLAGANGLVQAIAVQSDGKVVVGGAFSTVNNVLRNNIARLNTDGTLDTGFLSGLSGAVGDVYAVAVQQRDSRVLMGGSFTVVNGASRNRIARLNTDGTLDTGPASGLYDIDNVVFSVAIQSDRKALIGGVFSDVNGVNRSFLARLNTDGSLDGGFLNGLSGPDGLVFSVMLQSDGKILIGGDFKTVNDVQRSGLARLHPDGTVDTTFLDGLAGADGVVASVALQSDGKVLIGGDFTTVNGTSRNRLARLNTDGTLDGGFLDGLAGADDTVGSVVVQPDGKVLLGGDFTTVNSASRGAIARLNTDGTLDGTFLSGLSGPNGSVGSVVIQPDGKVLLGGQFTSVNGVGRNYVARLLATGALDTAFLSGLSGANSPVYALALQSDGRVVLGGNFTSVNGVTRSNIARLNADGTLDTGFLNNLAGANGDVLSVAIRSDGKVLMAGSFTMVNGLMRHRAALLNADGSDGAEDTGFHNPISGLNNYGYALALQSDGKVLVGGEFYSVNDLPRGHVARLNTDGSLDTGFLNRLAGAEGTVRAIAVQSNGKILIGGDFVNVNGVRRNYIARLNADGTLDTSFLGEPVGPNGPVYAIVVQSDGRILIGGAFSTVNGANRFHIARLNVDGRTDGTFQNGLAGADATVVSLALQSDGKVLLGGQFGSVNNVTQNGMARLNTDGTLDGSFLNGFAVSADVRAVSLQSDGKILLGGFFNRYGGLGRTNLARLNTNGIVDTNFLNGLAGADDGVLSLAPQSDGKILAGGIFGKINGVNRTRLARLNGDGTLDSTFLDGLAGANDGVNSILPQSDGRILITGAFKTFDDSPVGYLARLWGAAAAALSCPICLPRITVQPQSQNVLPGTNVSLTVTAAGTGPLRYQWSLNGTDLASATNATHSFFNASMAEHGTYSVRVSDDVGATNSSDAFIYVLVRPGFVSHPAPQTTVPGGTAVFTVWATGAPPIWYRWFRQGQAFATNDTGVLVLTNVQTTATIRAIATNLASGIGGVSSATVNLTVQADADGDGIGDPWAAQYGFTAADALLDSDGDGMINRDEYLAGTNPRAPLSALQLTSVGTNAALQFIAQSNLSYTVQYRTNLTTAPWISVTNIRGLANATRTIEVPAPDPHAGGEQYYRVVTPLIP